MSGPLLLFPFGGNAREAVEVALAANRAGSSWRLLGFVDDDERTHGRSVGSCRVLGGRSVLGEHPGAAVLAVPGSPDTYRRRREVIERLGLPRERFATLVHPTCQLGPGSTVGVNSLLMAGVVATVDVRIGDHSIVLPNTVLSHDVTLGESVLVGSNVSASGGVAIEDGAYVGSGARILGGVRIGAGSLVGLGAVVLADTEPGGVYVGNPARRIR